MKYIVRVVGYDAYWTGNMEPGKLWSTNIEESKIFENKDEAQEIVDSGMNMQVIEYDIALTDIQQSPPDWDEIDRKLSEIKNLNKDEEEIISVNDFETVSDEVHDVDIEVVQ